MADFQDLTSDELLELMENLEREFAHRQTSERLRSDVEKVIDDARDGGSARKPVDYEEWQKPRDVTQAYKDGERVIDKGQAHVSRITPNLCIPGECLTGWEETELPDDPEDTEEPEEPDEPEGSEQSEGDS